MRTQHLEKMKSCEDIQGQAIALENVARTYEYMANLTKACESLEKVREKYALVYGSTMIVQYIRERWQIIIRFDSFLIT